MRSSLLFVPCLVASAVAVPAPGPVVQRDALFDGLGSLLDLGLFDLSSFLHGALGLDLFQSMTPGAAAALASAAQGGASSTFNSSSKNELQTWITGDSSSFIDQYVMSAVQNWATSKSSIVLSHNMQAGLMMYVPACSAIASQGGIIVSVGGILSELSVTGQAVLDAGYQAALAEFLEGEADIDILAKDALHVAASGGSALSVSARYLESALEYLASGASKIDAALSAAVENWAKNTIADGVVAFETLGRDIESVIRATSVAGSVFDNVNGDGTLGGSARLSLAGIVNATAIGTFNGSLEASLNIAISGLPAINLSSDQVEELAEYLQNEACVFTAELKGAMIFWLHVGAKALEDAERVFLADTKALSEFLGSSAADVLSAVAQGAMALAAAGRTFIVLSEKAAAELAAILAAATNLTVSIGIEDQLIDWLLGIKRQDQ
jgi:hypothetical protein